MPLELLWFLNPVHDRKHRVREHYINVISKSYTTKHGLGASARKVFLRNRGVRDSVLAKPDSTCTCYSLNKDSDTPCQKPILLYTSNDAGD